MPLILASASPRRAELLTTAGIAFVVEPADVDETPLPGEEPDSYALRVAREKALVVARRRAGDWVLAADTVVVAGGDILGKPEDAADARRMLGALSGRVHQVLTAVVLQRGAAERAVAVERTLVTFVPLSGEAVEWYVSSGEPAGKAGAYAIQGLGSRFVERIEGSWSNVVGLPVATVYRLLREAGVLC